MSSKIFVDAEKKRNLSQMPLPFGNYQEFNFN